ncbi:AAA family ATPase [Candidatus Gracilibacteria bacterium]|nr:AAA family ATPase [Candidatus Gracilibacteria bacterium]
MTQDQAYDILTMGHNVFLTGAAGTGKTYLINRFIRHAREHGITIAVTASTGIAATHIGGMTIHSWSGMGIRDTLTDEDIDVIVSREYLAKRFAKTNILIIDEISMLSGVFLANLDRLLRSTRFSQEPFGGIQVVLVGDFFQLPPVSRGSDVEFAFEHPSWRTYRLAICVLDVQYRQGEDPLLTILNEIRSGDMSQESFSLLDRRNIPVDTEDHTELFTRNISVDTYNTQRLNAIHDDTFVFEMQSKGAEKLVEALKKGCLAPETLILKKGARVMFVKNNFEAGYVNGSIGHVVGKYESLPIVELTDGTRIIADHMDWSIEENGKVKATILQIPLRLAWAITVHKSQGMTLDTAVMDLSDAFVRGQGYVALSRVRSLNGLILRGYNPIALQIDSRVRDYDEILRATSAAVIERLAQISESEKETKIETAIKKLGGILQKIDLDFVDPKRAKLATHEETYSLIQSGKSLDDIAEIRNIKISTIFSHIEKLTEEGKIIDLTSHRPDDSHRLSDIHRAFVEVGTLSLSPIREFLVSLHDEDYTYDELRMARLFLSISDRAKIEEQMLYESEGI